MTRLMECKYGDVHIAVAPELGGALAWLRWRGQAILRPLDTRAHSAPICAAVIH